MKLPPLELLAKHDRDLCEQYSEQQAKAIPMSRQLLCRVLGKYLLFVDPFDISMTPHLAMLGHWEMWVTLAIARHVARGGHYVDVGAAYGYYTVLLGDLAGEKGKVEAFEPHAGQMRRLVQTCAVNGLSERVALHPYAVVEQPYAALPFLRGNHNIGSSALAELYSCGEDTQEDTVSAVSLDQLLGDKKIDFVKIDVEGAEARVWDGMRQLRGNPNLQILMELTPFKHPDHGRRILEEAQAEGFKLLEVGTEGEMKPQTVTELIRTDGPDLRMIWLAR